MKSLTMLHYYSEVSEPHGDGKDWYPNKHVTHVSDKMQYFAKKVAEQKVESLR